MADWVRVQGDQVNYLEAQLLNSEGTPLDIPPGTTAMFHGQAAFQPHVGTQVPNIGGNAIVERPGAEITDPNRGRIKYDLSTSDVAVSGVFYCRWILQPPSSSQVLSFPQNGRMILVILPSI